MLKENVDYYINEDGNFVFTREYHLNRGFCCKNKCLHCPWDYGKPQHSNPKLKSESDSYRIEIPNSEINKGYLH